MPAEDLRRRLMADANLYPEFGKPRSSQPISIASTSSTTSINTHPLPPKLRVNKGVIVSSSEEESGGENDDYDSEDEVVEISPTEFPAKPSIQIVPLQRVDNTRSEPFTINQLLASKAPSIPPKPPGVPIQIPTNKTMQPQAVFQRPVYPAPVETSYRIRPDDSTYVSPAETEKALRDLMTGSMNADTNVAIDMADATVKGFKSDISLLPHQILGRTWMKEREDVTQKRSGGILADDMGLGKTIQTITRIVEGRAKKVDKEEGWAATTLVVCPLALISQWADEIDKMTTGLVVIKHHGPSRTANPVALQKAHVVVTTYDVVKSEYESFSPAKDESKKSKAPKKVTLGSDDSDDDVLVREKRKTKARGNKKSALFEVRWWRVVLDEAHNIKNVKTKGAQACCELQAKFRWCLTGTPMQNNVTELYSLIKFLRIKPLNNWDTFNVQIAKPVNSGRGAGTAMKRLQVVLKAIMLRRTKDQFLNGKKLLDLPKRLVNIVSCSFNTTEKAFYDSLETQMENTVEKLMSKEKGKNNYISVLLLLLRLRQACNHPILVSKDYKTDMEAVEPKSASQGGSVEADPDDLAAAFGQLGVTRKCQICSTELDSKNTGSGEWGNHCTICIPLAIQAKKAELERPSSAKIRMVLKLLREVDKRSECEEKTIVFSQFTSMLDLLEPFLKEEGVKYVRYDGSMQSAAREKALAEIKTSTSTRVILISFKAGSTGLNLTACNNVILVDLWWNPALEDQAFDRSHRLGQTRDVNIFKLKIDNTVEDRILTLQDKKRAMAAAALSGDKLKNMRLGMDDLLALFRHGGRDEDEEDYD